METQTVTIVMGQIFPPSINDFITDYSMNYIFIEYVVQQEWE